MVYKQCVFKTADYLEEFNTCFQYVWEEINAENILLSSCAK